jgi:hypothetical protein
VSNGIIWTPKVCGLIEVTFFLLKRKGFKGDELEKFAEVDKVDTFSGGKKEYYMVNKFLNVMIKEWFINDYFYVSFTLCIFLEKIDRGL